MNYNTQTKYPEAAKQETPYTSTGGIQQEPSLGAAYSQTAGASDTKADYRAIPQAFSSLERDLYLLGELVNVLNNRLRPISKPEYPCPADNEKEREIDVPLVSALVQADKHVRRLADNVTQMIERLEL